MKVLPVLTLALLAPLLSACAGTAHCKGVQPYQRAATIPALQGTERLKLPSSPSALKIPPPPANAVAYGETYTDEDGDVRYRCLDVPPRLEPKGEEVPPDPAPPAS